MGCGQSTLKKTDQELEVDRVLKEDATAFVSTIKLLLLGAGESGKSTFAKQIRIIHLGGFSDEERVHFKEVIYENVLYSVKNLVQACDNHQINLQPENKKKASEIVESGTMNIDPGMGEGIKKIFNDAAIQKALTEKYQTFHLLDSASYFFANIDRIAKSDYTPTVDDLLRCRAKTTGIQELHLEIEKHKFIIVDVGGQRSERKKWIHCFQDVTAVLFFVALSEYDLSLYEDEETNRMHESLKLFDEICNSKWFSAIPIVLFLNKKDLFQEKIPKVNITVAFPDYDGPQTFDSASEYIQDQFMALNENPNKTIYPHVTQATDTKNIEVVFTAVRSIVISKAVANMTSL
jgi:GTPase SAR1 family protein